MKRRQYSIRAEHNHVMKRRAELRRARAGALLLAARNTTDEEKPDVPERVRWLSKRSGPRVSVVSVAGSRSVSPGLCGLSSRAQERVPGSLWSL